MPLKPLLARAADEVRRGMGATVEVRADDTVTLDADPIALERAVSNLLRNGVKAGGAPVVVRASDLGDEVLIEVADQGRGIPEDLQPHIFEPFFRGDPSRHRDGGTGLGLALVRAVVEAHSGRIDLTSKVSEGTTFKLRLPKRQPRVSS